MAPISKRRLRTPARRFDPADFRALMDDGKIHVMRALVVVEDGAHFEIVEGGADVMLSVKIMPHGTPATVRLSGLGGGPGRGFWAIPGLGSEVIVGVPEGELEAGAVYLGCESTGEVPDGLGPTTYVICVPAGGQLLVHDGTAAEAQPLATLASVQALRDYVDDFRDKYNQSMDLAVGHVHISAAPTVPTGPPQLPPGPPTPYTPPGVAPFPVPDIEPTDVLKAK